MRRKKLPLFFVVLLAIGSVIYFSRSIKEIRAEKSHANSQTAELGPGTDDFEANRWDPAISAKYEKVEAGRAKSMGCLSCHNGIMDINPKMQSAIDAIASAMGNPQKGHGCVICHEGNAEATSKEHAHRNLFPNPGSMWVISRGHGCAKCHSESGTLTTLMGKVMGVEAGGAVKSVISEATDPQGQSNHVYRMQRALMALEFGKASHTLMSNGVVAKGDYVYADFDMDDPDGPVPHSGNDVYKKWIAEAIDKGYIKRIEESRQIPSFEEGMKIWNDPIKASFGDYYRKQCARCHVWEEGRRERGDIRGGGCASCHVLYTNDALYEGKDPTIPRDRKGHMMKHEITLKIPATQCNHCHTRGKRIGTTYSGVIEFDYVSDGKAPPFDEQGSAQQKLYTKEYLPIHADIHFQKGIQCIDCHTSIDVHGDGNIYPTTLHQVEINCADCHGTPEKYPWELPIGYGTPVVFEGERGTHLANRKEHVFTSRGNAKANVERRGKKAVLTSLFDGKEHEIPLLKEKKLSTKWKTPQGRTAMADIPQHMEKLECYACHSNWVPQCYGCHTVYDRRKTGTDWISTAMNRDPKTGRQRITKTKGEVSMENRSYLRWEDPVLGVNEKGRVTPVAPGCQVFWTYVDEDGKIITLNDIMKTSTGDNALTMAPVQPHSVTVPARSCENCHVNPKTMGYGTSNTRSQGEINGDKPLFTNNADGYYGDIPGSETAKWQVPQIPEFPYSLDQLVTRGGKQVQNMSHLKDRPLDEAERKKMEREGLCASCHQYYQDPMWERIRKRLRVVLGQDEGRALTPELHDKAVEALLNAFAKEQ